MTIRDGACLVLQAPPEDGGQALWFRAASPPELQVWQRELGDLLAGLQSEAALARLLARERRHVICMPPFVELPHAGSRNLRERRHAKHFFTCTLASTRRRFGLVGPSAGAECCLSVTSLPPGALPPLLHSAGDLACEVLFVLDSSRHPFLLPALLAETATQPAPSTRPSALYILTLKQNASEAI